MNKKSTLPLLLLGGASLLMVACGGGGSNNASDINPGEVLSFAMTGGNGTIKVVATTPTSGIVKYLSVSALTGDTQLIQSNQSINFYYQPSEHYFSIDFTIGNEWYIAPGPITVLHLMSCSFQAVLTPTWENGSQKNGTMVYSFDRQAGRAVAGDHPGLDVSVVGQAGSYSFSYSSSL